MYLPDHTDIRVSVLQRGVARVVQAAVYQRQLFQRRQAAKRIVQLPRSKRRQIDAAEIRLLGIRRDYDAPYAYLGRRNRFRLRGFSLSIRG